MPSKEDIMNNNSYEENERRSGKFFKKLEKNSAKDFQVLKKTLKEELELLNNFEDEDDSLYDEDSVKLEKKILEKMRLKEFLENFKKGKQKSFTTLDDVMEEMKKIIEK